MANAPTSEGQIPFEIPGEDDLPCSTYYKVFGNLSGGVPPVVVLHGGPGGGHEYLLSFAELWPQYSLPVVFYDQIGCGASTHLPQKAGDGGFWQESLFVAELENLLDYLKLRDGPGFHLLGQSWGGILGVAFAAGRPRGLRRLILASAVASMELSVQSIQMCRSKLPMDVQEVLNKCVKDADYESPAYKEVLAVFHKMFVCRAEPVPAELVLAFQHLGDDPTVSYSVVGIPRLSQIVALTLVYNGEYDTSHDISQEPFFQLIPRVRWTTFQGGSHMCHLDDDGIKERVLKTVGEFLTHRTAA